MRSLLVSKLVRKSVTIRFTLKYPSGEFLNRQRRVLFTETSPIRIEFLFCLFVCLFVCFSSRFVTPWIRLTLRFVAVCLLGIESFAESSQFPIRCNAFIVQDWKVETPAKPRG